MCSVLEISTQFTCGTSTKLQILTANAVVFGVIDTSKEGLDAWTAALEQVCNQYSIYLLYQYNSTNTDGEGAAKP
jgi:hypothetical protein